MAPEQFEGKDADSRADIWAFGAVLYEMATGQKAFRARVRGVSLAPFFGGARADGRSPLQLHELNAPYGVVRSYVAASPKTPKNAIMHSRHCAGPPQAAPAMPNRWPWAVAGSLRRARHSGSHLSTRQSSGSPLPVKLDVNPPPDGRFAPTGNIGGSAISPDGRTLAYVANDPKGQHSSTCGLWTPCKPARFPEPKLAFIHDSTPSVYQLQAIGSFLSWFSKITNIESHESGWIINIRTKSIPQFVTKIIRSLRPQRMYLPRFQSLHHSRKISPAHPP